MPTPTKDFTTLVLIGNGFDLNLGLKTSYTNFINSKEFTSLLGRGNYLAERLQQIHDLQRWIDVENELKNYSVNTNIQEAKQNFKIDFQAVSNSLRDYLFTLEYHKIDTESQSYKMLEQIKDKDFLILDYNYTPSTKNLLLQLGVSEAEIQDRIIKVHGTIESGEIIFGVEDNADIKPEHVFLRKAYSKSFKSFDFDSFLLNAKELHILGHSLGETDHMYFKIFFERISNPGNGLPNKTITLYHYGEEGYDQLHRQLDILTYKRLSQLKKNNTFHLVDTSIQ